MFLDLNFTKLLVLGVIALIVFGPDRLPVIAAQAGRLLRELRRVMEGARSELQENLGPEFSQLDLADLNPKHFVRKHLADELTGDGIISNAFSDVRNAARANVPGSDTATGNAVTGSALADGAASGGGALAVQLTPGERPPYDTEAT